MKKIHFVAIALIGLGVFLLVRASGDMSTYSTFEDAERSGKVVKIVGHLAKDKEMVYNPEIDPNYFSFFVKDMDGQENEVVFAF